MSATLPITLTPIPVPIGVKATDINQFITIVTQFISASVNADVSFFQTVTADPSVQTTPLIFNSAQAVFKYWDTGLGKYMPITQFQAGDIKNTYINVDSPQTGWIICDGRAISAVPNISQNQQAVLNSLFGAGGSLPDLSPLQSISGLPSPDAFSSIPVAGTTPPQNQIANLPFSADYNPVEEQNLAGNTEQLRTSQDSLRTSVVAIQTASQQVLSALNTATTGMVTCVFVGYP